MSVVDDFRASSPRRQILIVAAGALMIAIVLACVYFFVLRKPYAVLFSDLRTADAATIVAELDKKKTPYRLADGGTTILVPRQTVDATRLALANADLPLKGSVGFELFNKSDMGLTEFAQKINYQRALQGELARTIMTLDGVDSARVHLSLAEPTIFRDDRRPPKASATIIPRAGRQLDGAQVRGIQRLIAAAVPDLDANDVVILDETGRIVSGDATPAPAPTPKAGELRAIEGYYAARIRQIVADAGESAATDVSVEIDPAVARAVDMDRWTPASRTFPLKVSIYLQPLPGLAAQQALRARVLQALGGANEQTDAVIVLPATPAEAAASSPRAVQPSLPTHRPAAPSPSAFWLAILVPVVLGLLALAWMLARRGRPSAPTPRGAQYVRRLEQLLDEEDAHAASRA